MALPKDNRMIAPCQHCGSDLPHDTSHCERMKDVQKWTPNPIDNDNAQAACGDLSAKDEQAILIEGLQSQIKSLTDKNIRQSVANIGLMSLIGEILQEAQEHPQRLTAFNSPLLGMLMLYYHAHISSGDVDSHAMQQLRAVVDARNAP